MSCITVPSKVIIIGQSDSIFNFDAKLLYASM